MTGTYKYKSGKGGESNSEIVILQSQKGCDLNRVIHDAALEYCMTKEGARLCRSTGGLSFGQLMDNAGPELFAKYGVNVIRPSDYAVQMDQAAPIISLYELDACENTCKYYQQQVNLLRDFSSRISRRLFTLWKRQHPVISTWDPAWIPSKGVEWAYKFLAQGKPHPADLDKFFDQKVQEAAPSKCAKKPTQELAIVETPSNCTVIQ